jgi:hypothetical protein
MAVMVVSSLHRYLDDMFYALKAGGFYSSKALSLTVPDICGSIDYPADARRAKAMTPCVQATMA